VHASDWRNTSCSSQRERMSCSIATKENVAVSSTGLVMVGENVEIAGRGILQEMKVQSTRPR